MPRVRRRNAYHHVSDFDKGRIVAYRDCGLSYRDIAARVGRDPMTVSRIWNRWVQEGNTERRAGSQRPRITSSRDDRHLIRMAVTDRAATSRSLSQQMGTFARQQPSARTVRRRLQQHGLSARRPWLRLPLTLHHRQERLQWCTQRRTWVHEWQNVIFSDESRFCLQHHDGRIRVWRHRGERTLEACIRHRHTGVSPGVMVWGAIGYTSRSPLVRIDGTLNSGRYISDVLRPVALPFIRSLRNPTFQQDNARPHVAGPVRAFLDTENVRLLPWPARSPDLSPIENVWSMVAEQLARHNTPVTTLDELWYRVEAAWASVPVHAIQALFDSMPRRIKAVITARGGCSGY